MRINVHREETRAEIILMTLAKMMFFAFAVFTNFSSISGVVKDAHNR